MAAKLTEAIRTLGLDLDELHPWVFGLPIVYAVSEITKPGTRGPAPNFFDPWVVVAARHGLASDGNPVLVAAVLEGDCNCAWVLLDVVELLTVCISEEEEVWSRALGDCHRAMDRSCALAESA